MSAARPGSPFFPAVAWLAEDKKDLVDGKVSFYIKGEGFFGNNVIKLRKITANTSKTNANKAAVLRKNPYFLI